MRRVPHIVGTYNSIPGIAAWHSGPHEAGVMKPRLSLMRSSARWTRPLDEGAALDALDKD